MKKRRKKKGSRGFSVLMIFILLPLLVTIVMQNMQIEQLMAGVGQAKEGGKMPEEVLIGIVAKEINVTADEEVLRAQCVIARTNYLDAKKKGAKVPETMTIEEMQEIFGEKFSQVYKKLERCVNDTAGEVLTWQGDYIYAAYHAVSNGNTRRMEELYGDVQMPYLSCRECHEDTAAEGYLAVFYWKKDEFLQRINEAFPQAKAEDTVQIQITERDTVEYVLKIRIGETECSGEEFRSVFGLNSACFTIADTGENVRVVTRGIGHGFGLSQYTAAVLAEEGKNYREILAYFFPEAELSQKMK